MRRRSTLAECPPDGQPQGLLLTKQTMRDKDMADRQVIERALQALRERDPPTQG